MYCEHAPNSRVSAFKYGDEYFPESSIQRPYTHRDGTIRTMHVATNFLIYNKRCERLQSLEKLPRRGGNSRGTTTLFLYALLLPLVNESSQESNPLSELTTAGSDYGDLSESQTWRLKPKPPPQRFKKRGATGSIQERYDREGLPKPYPVRVELVAFEVDLHDDALADYLSPMNYSRRNLFTPQLQPGIIGISQTGQEYRLAEPANRYAHVYFTTFRKYVLCYRVWKYARQASTFQQLMTDLSDQSNLAQESSIILTTASAARSPFAEEEILQSYSFVNEQLKLWLSKKDAQRLKSSDLMNSYRNSACGAMSDGTPLSFAVLGYPV